MSILEKRNIFLALVGVTFVYYVTASFGLSLAVAGTNATPIWPPAGIAVAAIFAFGPRIWPAILLGAFAANLSHIAGFEQVALSQAIAISSGIALGNVLEGLCLYALSRGLIGRSNPFDEPIHIFKFVLIVGISSVISSSIGTLSIYATGIGSLSSVFVTWWLGDALAILIITPFLLYWWPLGKVDKNYKWLELIAVFLLIFFLCEIVFGGHFEAGVFSSRPSLLIPPLIWLAFRFSRRELLTAVALVSAAVIYATTHGTGPFLSSDLNESLLSGQLFCAMIAVTMLVLAATVSKNAEYQKALVRANEELENQVEQRTKELHKKTLVLEAINNQLRIEVRERLEAENRLRSLQSKDI